MVAAPCLACAPDPCPLLNPSSSSSASPSPTPPSPVHAARFIASPREALRFLNARCHTPWHLKQAHAYLIRCGLGRHPDLLTDLLRRYASHGGAHIRAAAATFSQLPQPPPAFAWNVMMRAVTVAGRPGDALLVYYNRMAVAGVPPDKFTFPFAVKACAASGDLRKGMEVHARAIKAGLFEDIFLQNMLMHLYFQCEEGDALYGHLVFARMRVRNMVSWTTLVSGLATRGDLESATAVFEEMPVRKNVITWTAMVDAYARNGQPEKALEMFRKMQVENVQPNEFTVVALLIACTELGSIKLGRWVHDYARKNGCLDGNVYVRTALIDMYSKCGSLDEARRVFDFMPQRSVATWNSMITGLGVHGHGGEAIDLFRKMEKEGFRPDEVTFRGVLCACVRAGLTLQGLELFRDMVERHGITPAPEHHRFVVELLEQTGLPEETQQLVPKLRTEREDVGITLQTLLIAREGEELLRRHVHGGLEQSGGDVPLPDQEQLGWEVG